MKTLWRSITKLVSFIWRQIICGIIIPFILIVALVIFTFEAVNYLLGLFAGSSLIDIGISLGDFFPAMSIVIVLLTYSNAQKEKQKSEQREITAAKVVFLPTLQNIYLKTHHFTRRQQWVLLRYCQEVKNSKDGLKARKNLTAPIYHHWMMKRFS